MHIVDMKVYFDVQGMTVQFDNLFNGNDVLGKCHSVCVGVNKNTVRSTHFDFCFASSQALAVIVLTIHGNPTSFTGLPQQPIDITVRQPQWRHMLYRQAESERK